MVVVLGNPELAEIYATRSLGCFLELISFPAGFVTFDLLSKVKYTKMVLVSCGRGSRENRWAELVEIYTTRSLGCFLLLISFLVRSVTFDLLSKVKYTKMVLVPNFFC